MKSNINLALKSMLSGCCLLISSAGFAGTQIIMDVTAPGDKSPKQATMDIQNDLMRMETPPEADGEVQPVVIFDAKKQTMLMIDHTNKSYFKVDPQTMKQIKSRMEMMKKQMEAQMANMPAEQRAMMEKMMKERMPGMQDSDKKKVPHEVRKTSRSDSAGGYDCQVAEVYRGQKKLREMCVTKWSEIRNGDEVSSAFKGMVRMMKDFQDSVGQMGGGEDMPFTELEKLGGFPIISTESQGDSKGEVSRVVSIKDKSFDKTRFEPPKGYRLQSMMQ